MTKDASHNKLMIATICVVVGMLFSVVTKSVDNVKNDKIDVGARDASAAHDRNLKSDSLAIQISISDVLLAGWVAEVSAREVSSRDEASVDSYAGSIGGSTEMFVAEFDVIRWLRVDEDGVGLTRLISASASAPRSNAVAPLPISGIAVMMPYKKGPGLESFINLSEAVARERSADTGESIASAGWLVEWLPRTPDGQFVFREGKDQISIEEIELALEGKTRPTRGELDRKAPDGTRMSVAQISAMQATIDSNKMARRENATATQRAAHDAAANSAYSVPFFWPSRHTGPMDQQLAVNESIARFVPGKRTSVAFVNRMKASRALEMLGHSQEHLDYDVWFVGIVAADGVTRREHAKFFEGSETSVVSGGGDDVEGVVGEYYIWSADKSSLIQMGGLTTGFGINSDVELIQKRLTE